MFERFTTDARTAVLQARAHSLRLGHRQIGTEHLLLGVLVNGLSDPTARLLIEAGITTEAVIDQLADDRLDTDPLDAQVLALLGIDLPAVQRAAEMNFGPGVLDAARVRRGRRPMSTHGKQTLQLALREAVALGHSSLTSGHLLLGLLRTPDARGAAILRHLGASDEQLRPQILAMLARQAA